MGLIVQAFWCEPTGRERRWFRCYQSRPAEDPTCRGYCSAMKLLGDGEENRDTDGNRAADNPEKYPQEAFPVVCDTCGRTMDVPERQIFSSRIYVAKTGPRAGEEFPDREFPVGAMRDCEWLRDMPGYRGADGIALEVRVPDGGWLVDSRASNCTLPDDNVHKCWCRHGDPRTGYCHVDKDCATCAAGGGSIQTTKWHGFLHRGYVCEDRAEVDRLIAAATVPVSAATIVPLRQESTSPRPPSRPTGAVKAFGAWRSSRRR